jgi:hypothetical protein
MEANNLKDGIRKVLLGILGFGLLFLAIDVLGFLQPSPPDYSRPRRVFDHNTGRFVEQPKPSKSLSYLSLWGLLGIGVGVGGFYILSLASQPDSDKGFVRFLQQTTRSITGDPSPPPPPKSVDEQKREAAERRLRDETSFRVHTKAGKKLYTFEAWQEWRKKEGLRIMEEHSKGRISYDEMTARLAQADTEYSRGMNDLKSDANIFEEEQ